MNTLCPKQVFVYTAIIVNCLDENSLLAVDFSMLVQEHIWATEPGHNTAQMVSIMQQLIEWFCQYLELWFQ